MICEGFSIRSMRQEREVNDNDYDKEQTKADRERHRAD